jgi:hypothetical protein
LRTDGLIPPVKAVDTVGGGIVRVTVIGAAEPELRARLTAAMGAARWKLVEASDEGVAGAIDYGVK